MIAPDAKGRYTKAMRRIEPAQYYGPVTDVVLVDNFGRQVVGEVLYFYRETTDHVWDGKPVDLTWYVVSTRAGILTVSLRNLTMIPSN